MLGVKAALQSLAQLGQLGAQPALGQLGEDRGVRRAGDERVQHPASGDTEDVRGDAVQLDGGVLEDLVQPVGLALSVLDLGLAITRQVA